MDSQVILQQINEIVLTYGPRLLGAIVVYIVGSWVITGISSAFASMMERRNVDDSLRPFLKGLVKGLLKVMLILSVLGMMGIEMTSFIAVLGAIGLAIGMALSGTLQNFAGGVMILLFKPFKVGDYIDAQGYSGTVSEIQIFNTILKTPDNKTIIIPNGGLATNSMVNYSTEPQRRVDWTFGIGYGDDADKAEAVIRQLLIEDTRVLKDPEIFIAVSELADSSVNFAARAWVNAEDYWPLYFDMNKKVYKRFEQEGLNIPFPQMDIHLQKQ
ncbi:MAG: mechanosensitive ion channel [Saprospiraceae bacterium]|nr:mechanosensitive ion channel [Saprospiraceae bacterium]